MTKTVVGLFDSSDEAHQVVQELTDRGFSRDDMSLVARDTSNSDKTRAVGADEGAGTGAVGGTVMGGALGLLVGAGLLAIPGIGPVLAAGPLAAAIGTTAATVGAGALGAGIGAAAGGLIGGLVGAGVPEEQAQYYAEGVRRGGTLMTVSSDDDKVETVKSIMNSHGVIDMKQRGREWRDSGWDGFRPDGEPYNDATASASTTTATRHDSRNDRAAAKMGQPQTSGAMGETVLPVIEEEIDIQKRRVEQGGVRVNTRVEEKPVDESINLREERVHVDRHAVDRPVTDADATAFEERSFELTESTEEPVVRKRARVVEEVVVTKEVQERTETIHDTVRRTDVDVEQISGTGRTADVSGTTARGRGIDAFDTDFRSHYKKNYSSAGLSYDDYKPVYQYGYDLANDQRMSGRQWSDIESDARTNWDESNPGTWEQFKDTVRYAWDKARGKR